MATCPLYERNTQVIHEHKNVLAVVQRVLLEGWWGARHTSLRLCGGLGVGCSLNYGEVGAGRRETRAHEYLYVVIAFVLELRERGNKAANPRPSCVLWSCLPHTLKRVRSVPHTIADATGVIPNITKPLCVHHTSTCRQLVVGYGMIDTFSVPLSLPLFSLPKSEFRLVIRSWSLLQLNATNPNINDDRFTFAYFRKASLLQNPEDRCMTKYLAFPLSYEEVQRVNCYLSMATISIITAMTIPAMSIDNILLVLLPSRSAPTSKEHEYTHGFFVDLSFVVLHNQIPGVYRQPSAS